MNPVVRGDIVVAHFLDSVGGYRHKERRDRLLNILDVDLDWHMHAISDGERRRVQLVMGLMAPWDVLLLDEVTVDLDVLVRDNLLSFLREECETRNAAILYATHIFDGLDTFPTHVAHMRLGSMVVEPTPWPLPSIPSSDISLNKGSSLYTLALHWLTEDREHRRALEKDGRKARGAKVDQVMPTIPPKGLVINQNYRQGVPTDSETFYRKYDYSH
jgi:CCR4-NOT complex subunit CAF16